MFLLRFMPYQIFFTLGLIYTIIGLLLWPLWSFGLIPYPLLLHRHLMIWGGLGAFATGFMLTSVPCFTGTKTTTIRESQSLLIIHALFAIALPFVSTWPTLSSLSSLGLSVGLGLFFYRRAFAAKYKLPLSFHLIGVAFLLGGAGALAGLFYHWQASPSPLWFRLEQTLSFQSAFLTLLLGVGSRLFTGIFGLNLDRSREQRSLWILGALLGASLLEVVIPTWALGLATFRGLCLLLILNSFWRFPMPPKTKTWEALWTWLFWLSVAIGALLMPFASPQPSSSQHFLFIGGFLGLTLVIASRIIMAHGGYLFGNPTPILRRLRICFSLILASLVLRQLALIPTYTTWMIPLAGGCALLALLIWAVTMVPKIFKRNELIFRRGP